jgi:hypothetical protein
MAWAWVEGEAVEHGLAPKRLLVSRVPSGLFRTANNLRKSNMSPSRHFISRFLVVSMIFIGLPAPLSISVARAEMVTTQRAAEAGAAQPARGDDSRARVQELLARADVREALQSHGITPDQAQARVAALSDEEVRILAERMNVLPAGGDGILGILFAVFIILLVTDVLGFTKVFPFTRSVR